MKVKDLRIGNIVYGGWEDYEENSHFSICLVTGLSEDQYLGEGWNFMLENMETKGVENYFEMKPIPLTEEWLLKFGFDHNFKNHEQSFFSKKISEKFELTFRNNKLSLHLKGYGMIETFDYSSVHQLQNLYFAICGEDLELKETL